MLSVVDEGVEDEDEVDLMPTDETDIGIPDNKLSQKMQGSYVKILVWHK